MAVDVLCFVEGGRWFLFVFVRLLVGGVCVFSLRRSWEKTWVPFGKGSVGVRVVTLEYLA